MSQLKAFQIKVGTKILNYRLGEKLDLAEIKSYFNKKYGVKKLLHGSRHIFGELEKDNNIYFLKLSTSEGIGHITKTEFLWNDQFNKLVPRESSSFWVPKNFDSGLYKNKYFYLITDKLDGKLLAETALPLTSNTALIKYLSKVIELSELIQKLNITNLSEKNNTDHHDFFLSKTKSWYNDIPAEVTTQFKIADVLGFVTNNVSTLEQKPRHGDFAPWHIMAYNNYLFLIDGEHALSNGVQYYDIAYFIQRVFSVLESKIIAEKIYAQLKKRDYDITKLKTVLAARAIGGFLDESLKDKPNYKIANDFKNWVISL